MTKEQGGPAFPSKIENISDKSLTGFNGEDIRPRGFSAYPGMSLRDYFAAKALQGMLSYPGNDQWGDYAKMGFGLAAETAYNYADAMIEARAK